MEDYLGRNIPKLGFGLMRLPMDGQDVDIELTKKMVDLFLEKGFTYFDTAFGYINGKSETAAKEALVDRYPRDKFQLATKLPAWMASSKQEAEAMFWTSLKRAGVDYFDFYLLHNLGDVRTKAFEKFGIWDFLKKQKQDGRILHLGFSMHAKAGELEEVLKSRPEMEFVQLQINYADWEDEVVQSKKCYDAAIKYNKPVIIMEPVKGGLLSKLPESAADILNKADPKASQASWAVRFAASLNGVITVLSGMSSLEQMEDNVSFMENFKPLDSDEYGVIKKVQAELSNIPKVPCTDCRYCLKDCPKNIAISGIFTALNYILIYNDLNRAKWTYSWETKGFGKAEDCIACGRCEAVCPQKIKLIEELKRAAKLING